MVGEALVSYEWLDHTADIGVRGIGASIEEAFCETARGMFALMVDLRSVSGEATVEVNCRARSRELLLVEWLAELIAQKDLTHSVFASFSVEITVCDTGWRLHGSCGGDAIDPERHRLGNEVKGISLAGLRVEKHDSQWIAECIVDI